MPPSAEPLGSRSQLWRKLWISSSPVCSHQESFHRRLATKSLRRDAEKRVDQHIELGHRRKVLAAGPENLSAPSANAIPRRSPRPPAKTSQISLQKLPVYKPKSYWPHAEASTPFTRRLDPNRFALLMFWQNHHSEPGTMRFLLKINILRRRQPEVFQNAPAKTSVTNRAPNRRTI